MGIDASILIKAKPGFETGEINDMIFRFSGVCRPVEESTYDETHIILVSHRYYNIGYERGFAPSIIGILLSVFSNQNIEKVWYGGDCIDHVEYSQDDVFLLAKHWILNGNRPLDTKKQ